MFYYPKCKKLLIGSVDNNALYLDFELDAYRHAYIMRLYYSIGGDCQCVSKMISLSILESFKGSPKFILNQYFKECLNSLEGSEKLLIFNFELFLNGGVTQKKLK